MRNWKAMRQVEKERMKKKAKYARYKNEYFINLIRLLTGHTYWDNFDLNRLKILRFSLETEYNIPINFFRSFVALSTHKFLQWPKRDTVYWRNYIGFISHARTCSDFADFIAKKNFSWRTKNSKWPDDFWKLWGMKISIKLQKLGFNDRYVRYGLMSDYLDRKIKEMS